MMATKQTAPPPIAPMAAVQYLLEHMGKGSHLKLQKLLYFADAWHLAYFQAPLFKEEFQAWAHGPVLRSVWDRLKGLSPLYTEIKKSQLNGDLRSAELPEEQRLLLDAVLKGYGKRTEDDLERIAHADAPWIDARGTLPLGEPCARKISKTLVKATYAEKRTRLDR
jgi:uncharacterized phage-associated protein